MGTPTLATARQAHPMEFFSVAACHILLNMARKGYDKPQVAQDGISNRIRDARHRSGLAPAELRKILADNGINLSKTGLHRLETSEPVNPNLRLMIAIAEATHVTPEWLLFGTGSPRPDEKIAPAIRARVIDTIAFMAGALDLTEAQERDLEAWLASVRRSRPERIRKP